MRMDAVGCNHYNEPTFHCLRPKGAGDWLLVITKSPCRFVIDGEALDMPPYTLIIYTPEFPVDYRPIDCIHIDDWIHFEPDNDEKAIIEKLGLPVNRPAVLGNIEAATELIRFMCFEFYSSHKNRLESINGAFHTLLYKLEEQLSDNTPDPYFHHTGQYLDHLIWLRTSFFRWPEQDWSADVLAKEMRLSPSRFQHLYTETFGTSMLHDITEARVHRAATLLRETHLSIEQIAEECGYTSTSHFIRTFRKHRGITPLQYRKK